MECTTKSSDPHFLLMLANRLSISRGIETSRGLIARATRVPAAKTIVIHPCDESPLRGVVDGAQNGILFQLLSARPAVTSSKTGLRTARRISHVFVMDVPTYPETLFITDAAINIFPDLDAKHDIIQNAIGLFTEAGLGTRAWRFYRPWRRSPPKFPRPSRQQRCARWPSAVRSPAACLMVR